MIASDNFAYALIAVNPGNNEIGLSVFPVPANKQLNVVFSLKTGGQVTMSLFNSAGKAVYTQIQTAAPGNFSTILNVGNLPSGSYLLRVSIGNKAYTSKVLIVR